MPDPDVTPADPAPTSSGVAEVEGSGLDSVPGVDTEQIIDLEAIEAEQAETAESETAETETAETSPEPSGTADAQPETESAEADEAEAPESEPEAEAADDAGEAESEEGEPETQGQKPEPFSFRVDGQTVDVPGAIRGVAKNADGEDNDYILIPTESWRRVVSPRLVDRPAVLARERQLQAKLEELNPEHHPDVVRAKAIVEYLDGEVLASEEKLRSFLENYDTARALMKERVDNRVLNAKEQARTTRDEQAANEAAISGIANYIAQDLPQAVDAVVKATELPENVAQAFRRRLLSNPGAYYAQDNQGRVLRNDDAIIRELEYTAAVMGDTSKNGNGNPSAKRKVAEAKNRAELGKKTPKTPPSPTASPASAGAAPVFKSEDEYRAWLKG